MEFSVQYRGCIGLALIVFFIKSGPRGLSKLFFRIELYCIIFFDILLFLFRNLPLLPSISQIDELVTGTPSNPGFNISLLLSNCLIQYQILID